MGKEKHPDIAIRKGDPGEMYPGSKPPNSVIIYFENGPMAGERRDVAAGTYEYIYLSPYGGTWERIDDQIYVEQTRESLPYCYRRAGKLYNGMPVFVCSI